MKMIDIINDAIKEDARAEALKITELSSKIEIEELQKYYETDNLNAFCMHLDTIKNRLVKEDKLKQGDFDAFGGDYFK